MNNFTIRDIENLCRIKAHTLRIWEQRYNLCVARRKQSRHRVYDNNDLKELLRVSFLYHTGHKISRIAACTRETIHAMVCEACACETEQVVFIHQLIEAGIDLDEKKFEHILNRAVQRMGIERSISEVFFPFLERIGLLWMTNNVIPAQEHFVSNLIRKKIILAIDELPPTTGNKALILLFTPTGEHHEIPLLAVNYFFRKNGHHTLYFGANVPLEAIYYYSSHYPPDYIYTHVITHLNNQGFDEFIDLLCKKFAGTRILVSGPATHVIDKKHPNLTILNSLEEMITLAGEKL